MKKLSLSRNCSALWLLVIATLTAPAVAAPHYIGDGAQYGTAVPAGVGSNNFRADTITQLSYITSSDVPSTVFTAPGNVTIRLLEVNYAAQNAGSLTPFVARFNGGATNNANNYTLLSKGDVLASPGTGSTLGTLANQAFMVSGSNPVITLTSGQTLVSGWFQSSQIVVFQNQSGSASNDKIWASNIVSATSVGSNFTAGNAGFNFNLDNYRFNVGFEFLGNIWDANGATAGSGNSGGNWSDAKWTSDAVVSRRRVPSTTALRPISQPEVMAAGRFP